MKDIKRVLSGVFGYLLSVGMAVVFALYLSGRVGWFLVFVFVLAPVLSALFAWCVSRQLQLEAEPDSDMVSKGDICRLYVKIENRGLLPSPPVQISIRDSVSLKCQNSRYLVSVMPFSKEFFAVDFTARICGNALTGMENIVVTDYFGLFSFSVKAAKNQHFQWNIGVIPEIAEISDRDERFGRIVSACVHAENSEDTVETVATSLMGFPGYENREYVPGDPLKRINWKLSAKRDRLLVRLDDEAPGLFINVVLDSCFYTRSVKRELLPQEFAKLEADEQLPMLAQTAIEESLGLALVLMKRNYTVAYYMRGRQQWEQYRLMNEQDLSELRKALAHYAFDTGELYQKIPGRERMPYEAVLAEKETLTLICTPCADAQLEQEIKARVGGRLSEVILYPVISGE